MSFKCGFAYLLILPCLPGGEKKKKIILVRSFLAFFDLYSYDLFIYSDLFIKASFRLNS